MNKKPFLILLTFLITVLLLQGCTETPICGDNICQTEEKTKNSPYYCPQDCEQIQKTCTEQGGTICKEKQKCDGTITDAKDTEKCCIGTCYPKEKGTLSVDTLKEKYFVGEKIKLTDPPEIDLSKISERILSIIEKMSQELFQEKIAQMNKIKEELEKTGGLWKAGYTKPFVLSNEEFKGLLGLKLTEKQKEDLNKKLNAQKTVSKHTLSELPQYFDWRNQHGQNYITPIKDQSEPHRCGSCWAFASIAGVEGKALTYYNNPDLNLDLSEQDIVSCSDAGSCRGGYVGQALNYIGSNGTALESCFPYTSIDAEGCDALNCGFDPALCSEKCSDWQQNAWKIAGYNSIKRGDIEAIKKALIERGPVITGMAVYEDFKAYKEGIYSHVSGGFLGYHAILIVGYGQRDGVGYWIVKNSWGTDWGNKGYFKIRMGDSGIDRLFIHAINQPNPPNEQKIKCTDKDEDNYCNWGLTLKKPVNCPPCNNSTQDCDDSDAEIFQNCNMDIEPIGYLKVNSSPDEAKVYVKDLEYGNYIFRGTAPLTIEMNPGIRKVKISKFLYSDETRTVEVKEGKTTNLSVSLKKDPIYQKGWPQNAGRPINDSSPLMKDIDGDGMLDIIVCSEEESGVLHDQGELLLWHHDGTLFEGWPRVIGEEDNTVHSTPAAGDLDNDGDLEILAATIEGRLHVFYSNGEYVNGWPKRLGGATMSAPSLADLDGDKDLEIIIGGNNKVYAFHHNGEAVQGWPKQMGGSGWMRIVYSTPAIGDLDNDGDLEVVGGAYNGKIYVWHHDGSNVDGWPKSTGEIIFASPVLGDIDFDGDLEIFASNSSGEGSLIYGWHHNGSLIKGWPKKVEFNVRGLSLGDIDGDGDIEILASTYESEMGVHQGRVHAWHHNGKTVEGWPSETVGRINSPPSLGDIDGDGNIEVLAGADNYVLYAWKNNGNLFNKWQTMGRIESTPALGDVDKDGDLEIAVGSDDHRMYLWDLNGTYNPQNIEWSTFQQNSKHTGLYINPRLKQSKIVNNSEQELNGFLVMKIEELTRRDWSPVKTVVSKQISIPPHTVFKLDAEWNPKNVKLEKPGKYRVYAALLKTKNSEPLVIEKGELVDFAEFEVDYRRCTDGTPFGQCSEQKPKYCEQGELTDKCTECGCPPKKECVENTGKCRGKPDLIVESINVNPQTDKATATIKNQGNEKAGVFLIEFIVDETMPGGTWKINSLNAGKTTNVTEYYGKFFTTGKHKIKVTADYTNIVKESNENNNTKTITADFGQKPENCGDQRCEQKLIHLLEGDKKTVTVEGKQYTIKCNSIYHNNQNYTEASVTVNGTTKKVNSLQEYNINGLLVYAKSLTVYPENYRDGISTLILQAGKENTRSCPEDCENKCFDSEEEKNYYKRGFTQKGVFGYFECCYNPENHRCVYNQKTGWLREHYCQGNEHQSKEYECPNGCKNGACLGFDGKKEIECEEKYGDGFWCTDRSGWQLECRGSGEMKYLPESEYCAGYGGTYNTCVTCIE